jgi:peptide/nickel transport system ATP-binding protein
MYDADYIAVDSLTVRAGEIVLVQDLSLRVNAGEIVALVGESGSGKTLTARSFLGLVRARPGVVAGHVTVAVGTELVRPHECTDDDDREAAFDRIRGRLVGYLPQDALGWLDPLWTIGRQVDEVVALASRGSSERSIERQQGAFHWLRLAGFSRPERIVSLYPHELSGGMAQRACIALALARGSRFLLADEPTTGLDPTVQQGILRQMLALKKRNIGILFITHDLRVVHRVADEVIVLKDGQVVDRFAGSSLGEARHPVTTRLLKATVRISGGPL